LRTMIDGCRTLSGLRYRSDMASRSPYAYREALPLVRADSRARVIVYAWVNDRDTLRKARASSDPYTVFAGMLAGGNPPDDWPALLAAAQMDSAMQRLDRVDKATVSLT